jgi:hypothetical protein
MPLNRPNLSYEELLTYCPNLRRSNYTDESQPTNRYNCYAWAAGYDDLNWDWYRAGEDYYWPLHLPTDQGNILDSLTQAYLSIGYEIARDDSCENGYDKIAIYVNSAGIPTHAARQLINGRWTSKLGEHQDIQHENLQVLEEGLYGSVARIMRRSR